MSAYMDQRMYVRMEASFLQQNSFSSYAGHCTKEKAGFDQGRKLHRFFDYLVLIEALIHFTAICWPNSFELHAHHHYFEPLTYNLQHCMAVSKVA